MSGDGICRQNVGGTHGAGGVGVGGVVGGDLLPLIADEFQALSDVFVVGGGEVGWGVAGGGGARGGGDRGGGRGSGRGSGRGGEGGGQRVGLTAFVIFGQLP